MSKLNPKWEAFCHNYTSSELGNATAAYVKAYGRDISTSKLYRIAQSSASRLLSNAIISTRISELLAAQGLNNEVVDTQLFFLIKQYADLGVKMRAIQEYNKLKGRANHKVKLEVKPISFEQHIIEHTYGAGYSHDKESEGYTAFSG